MDGQEQLELLWCLLTCNWLAFIPQMAIPPPHRQPNVRRRLAFGFFWYCVRRAWCKVCSRKRTLCVRRKFLSEISAPGCGLPSSSSIFDEGSHLVAAEVSLCGLPFLQGLPSTPNVILRRRSLFQAKTKPRPCPTPSATPLSPGAVFISRLAGSLVLVPGSPAHHHTCHPSHRHSFATPPSHACLGSRFGLWYVWRSAGPVGVFTPIPAAAEPTRLFVTVKLRTSCVLLWLTAVSPELEKPGLLLPPFPPDPCGTGSELKGFLSFCSDARSSVRSRV